MAGQKRPKQRQLFLQPAKKKLRKQSDSATKFLNQWIPEDTQICVLQKLPQKSLLRFVCVCKSWKSIISDPKFINSTQKLILSSGKSIYVMDYEESEGRVRKLDVPLKTKGFFNIMGSCNGLLLILIANKNLLWNTVTGEYKIIPLSSYPNGTLGLGYDHYANDYKVIWFPVFNEPFMYSLRTSSSRTLQKIPYCHAYCTGKVGTVVNNTVLYWHAKCCVKVLRTERDSCVIRRETLDYGLYPIWHQVILRIDVGDESKVLIQQPPGIEEGSQTEFMDFKGCFCAFESKKGRNIDVWILKEERAKLNWMKLMSIQQPRSLPKNKFLAPIYFARNGEVLMNVRKIKDDANGTWKRISTFYAYNTKEETFRRFKVDGIKYWSNEITYVESNSLAPLTMAVGKQKGTEGNQEGVELLK